jgi:predicted amidophosphoribosyltransferase
MSLGYALSSWFRLLGSASELLAPPCCGFCGAVPKENFRAICAVCHSRLEGERYPACGQCAAVLASPTEKCGACLGRADFPLRGVTGLFRYQGVGRNLILKLKRDHEGVIAQSLAEIWLDRAQTRADAGWLEGIDLVTCIPQRLRLPWEGRNAGPVNLARAIGRLLGQPAAPFALQVRKWMRRQHDLNMRQRQRNVRRAFRVRREQDIKGRAILVVDDVMTSGATLCSAAQTLLDAGASEVWGAVAARGQTFGGAGSITATKSSSPSA